MPPMPPPPPRPPTTSARQPCTGSPHPSHCPGGCRSPPTPRAYPRAPAPGQPRWPPRAAASSWWRTDSTLRRKSGRSTPPPTASCSRTLWGAEPLWGLQECDERDPRSLCPSLRASGTPPSVGCLRSGGHHLCTACFILRLPASVSTQTLRAADVGSTCSSLGTQVYV